MLAPATDFHFLRPWTSWGYCSVFDIGISGIIDFDEFVTTFLPIFHGLSFFTVFFVILLALFYMFANMEESGSPFKWRLDGHDFSKAFRYLSHIKKKRFKPRKKLYLALIPSVLFILVANKTVLAFYWLLYLNQLEPSAFNGLIKIFLLFGMLMGDLLTLYWNDVRTSSFKAPYLEGISKPELRLGIMALIFLVGLYFWTQKLAEEEAKSTLKGDGSFISFTYDNKPVQTTDSVVLLGTRKRYIILRDLRDSTNHFY